MTKNIPDFEKFVTDGKPIDVTRFYAYKATPISMLCDLLTIGGDFSMAVKTAAEYRAVAELMLAAFPRHSMLGTFNASESENKILLKSSKGSFVLSLKGPLVSNATEIPINSSNIPL